jgi:hypothetical protein
MSYTVVDSWDRIRTRTNLDLYATSVRVKSNLCKSGRRGQGFNLFHDIQHQSALAASMSALLGIARV